ncbi:hypothetical protein N658DRAFT_244240 [Parathielavia hyrcaniae]|uniref:Uncharacterized protein n=1 Tax=Parathielavia hyrcaniae TaxID=113614 RepID=A0AAN6Q5W9_9PEZI|nr:hypothetical protein N658DRAFT_244240 [Parathielavia hyrcaniae]
MAAQCCVNSQGSLSALGICSSIGQAEPSREEQPGMNWAVLLVWQSLSDSLPFRAVGIGRFALPIDWAAASPVWFVIASGPVHISQPGSDDGWAATWRHCSWVGQCRRPRSSHSRYHGPAHCRFESRSRCVGLSVHVDGGN